MHNNGRPSFEMCGIKNASVTLALVWWLAPAAIVNAQQPAPDRPTQPDPNRPILHWSEWAAPGEDNRVEPRGV